MNINSQQELLKGTLITIILKLLSQKGRMYGYELSSCVKELTDGKILIKEGSLYPALHKMELNGLIESESEYIGKRVRKYYKLTSQGEVTSKKAVNELLEFLNTIQNLITTEPNYGTA